MQEWRTIALGITFLTILVIIALTMIGFVIFDKSENSPREIKETLSIIKEK